MSGSQIMPGRDDAGTVHEQVAFRADRDLCRFSPVPIVATAPCRPEYGAPVLDPTKHCANGRSCL
jgi:hypothetical protein